MSSRVEASLGQWRQGPWEAEGRGRERMQRGSLAGIDENVETWDKCPMTVTLNERAQKLVEAQLTAGEAPSADEYVNEVLESLLTPFDPDDPALEASLIKALEGPWYELSDEEFLERTNPSRLS